MCTTEPSSVAVNEKSKPASSSFACPGKNLSGRRRGGDRHVPVSAGRLGAARSAVPAGATCTPLAVGFRRFIRSQPSTSQWHTHPVLVGLLPGIRHVRAPLVAGCCFLLAGWLVWGRHLPHEGEATGLLADAYRLGRQVGQPIVLGFVAFIAYVLGSTAIWLFNWFAQNVRRFARFTAEWLADRRAALWQWIAARLLKRLGRDPWAAAVGHPDMYLFNLVDDWPVHEDDYDLYEDEERTLTFAIIGDLSNAPSRLIGSEPEIYAEFDRRAAEAGMLSVLAGGVIPLTFAFCVIMPRMSVLIVVLGVATALVCGVRAASKLRGARSVLVDSALVGRIEMPRFRQAASALIKSREEYAAEFAALLAARKARREEPHVEGTHPALPAM